MYAFRQLASLSLAVALAAPAALTGCDGTGGSGVTGILRSNATLSALTLSAGTLSPAFTASTTVYNVAVPNAINTTTVSATPATSGATITVNGSPVAKGAASAPITLLIGTNAIEVKVVNPDGLASRTYTVTVTRSSI